MRRNKCAPKDGMSVKTGHGGMKRNRHDPLMSPNPMPNMSPLPGRPRDMLDYAKDEGLRKVKRGTRNKQQDKKMAKSMGQDRAKAKRAQRAAKMQAAAGAASDMAGQMAADQQRFSQEHDAAVREGSAMMQSQMRGAPGRAQAIIKNRRV